MLATTLLLAAVYIKDASYPLRNGCATDSAVVATLTRDDAITLQFAVNGESTPCYKVSTAKGDGYLPAAALANTEDFDKARRAGAALEVSRQVQSEAVSVGNVKGDAAHPLSVAARLLDANQPAEALRVLQAALRSAPKDAQLLAMAGVAAYRSDDVRRAAWYFKDSLEARPNAAVQQMYDRALKEAAADVSAGKKVGTRFVLRYDDVAVKEDTARAMVEALEQEYTRITNELGCKWDERITAIVQTRADYLRTTDAAEWSGGRYDGRIRIAMMETALGPRTRRVFAHELTHACLASLGRWPIWLEEGLAQRLSGDTVSAAMRQQIRAEARAGRLPRVDRLSQDWSRLSTQHAAKAYALALLAVDIYYRDYAQMGIRTLLNNPSMIPQITDYINKKLLE